MIALPIILPFMVAAIFLIFPECQRLQKSLAFITSLVIYALGLSFLSDSKTVLEVGGWEWPFGIVLVADGFSSVMVSLVGLVGIVATLYSYGEELRDRHYPLSLILLGSVNGAFLTTDLFNLYVWFEVMLMASFVLLSTNVSKDGFGGAFKYVLLNLVSSFMFLSGVGLLYGSVGALNFSHIASRLGSEDLLSVYLIAAAFMIKSALVPFYFWLPASYHRASATVSALFAALLTKVGIYSLIRVLSVFPEIPELLFAIGVFATISMLVGIIGAFGQVNLRRLLAFDVVSQVGFVLLGFSTGGLSSAVVFYLIHMIVVEMNLFLIAGVIEKRGNFIGSGIIGFSFIVSACALAGVPPFSGFFGKFLIIAEIFENSWVLSGVLALIMGLGTLVLMARIWDIYFWGEKKGEIVISSWQIISVIILTIVTLSLSIFSAQVLELCQWVIDV